MTGNYDIEISSLEEVSEILDNRKVKIWNTYEEYNGIYNVVELIDKNSNTRKYELRTEEEFRKLKNQYRVNKNER